MAESPEKPPLTRRRDELGLSGPKIAAMAHTSAQQIDRLEKGERRMTPQWARRLAPAYQLEPEDILAMTSEAVPLELSIAAGFSEDAPDSFDIPRGLQSWLQPPPALDRPRECFAAQVADDSADRLFPAGTILFVRRLRHIEGPLKPRSLVVVRHFMPNAVRLGNPGTEPQRVSLEVLVGRLGRSAAGDLTVTTSSGNRAVAASVIVCQAPEPEGFAERFMPSPLAEEPIVYAPNEDDPAELLGVVEFATMRIAQP